MFLVVDLFLEVGAFDGIRPRAPLYRGARIAAHGMVGEPIATDVRCASRPVPRHRPDRPAEPAGGARYLRRIAGTPKGREILLDCIGSTDSTPREKAEAARLLGATGEDALTLLARLLDEERDADVRRGVLIGIAATGHPRSVDLVLGVARTFPDDRSAALQALGCMRAPTQRVLIRELVGDPRWQADVRSAACRALGEPFAVDNVEWLAGVLADPSAPCATRVEAALALMSIADRAALPSLETARSDPVPEVARAARRIHASLVRRTVGTPRGERAEEEIPPVRHRNGN